MNAKTENFSISLNIELNDSKIRFIDESELQCITGGAVAVMGASLFGSTYTSTHFNSIAGAVIPVFTKL